MKKKSTESIIKLEKLVLDTKNPRFAELYNGSDKEEEIINYLLYMESGEEIVKAIFNAEEFYPDRPLWVLKEGDKYLVKDGNRRCAAVKALQFPKKYGLDYDKMEFNELPVLIYHNKIDLDNRIRQEHTSNLFREWGRIAKALEVHRLFTSGSSLEMMQDYDSKPTDLIKLASFYYKAVKITGDDLKKLLRSGRGKTGGKTIIFERLFKFRGDCGYTFKNKPHYEINIKNEDLFKAYIRAMVEYLKEYPETKTKTIDENGKDFLNKLNAYNFPPRNIQSQDFIENNIKKVEENNDISPVPHENITEELELDKSNVKKSDDGTTVESNFVNDKLNDQKGKGKKSIKRKPIYNRKKIPATVEKVIKECYNLDKSNFTNAKVALVRVCFECTLKFVIENTKYNSRSTLSESNHFREAYYNKGKERTYTDFTVLKRKFTELVVETKYKRAFENFDLQKTHQIIHNYLAGAVPADAETLCENLIHLLEFLLKEENELLNSLDLNKL